MNLQWNQFKPGSWSAGLALAATWLVSVVCRSESPLCHHMGGTFDMLNLPARRAGDWLLSKLGYILGERRLGPDMIVAPPGVPAILHTLGWLAFIVYWFVIG